ncbi:hypothetical protein QO259_17525 [Salinicola sp. JS01]|uniref:hypothetical protein n=1 Tax=Salinicola sp. JS01 TaxID=3050071 RepID=UPI00255B754B|nr:hypothetical protein [Salinicola sp. JS01]WIX32587.1 hypothetical protein QO259_17525 [Salinicola sp. JS01]
MSDQEAFLPDVGELSSADGWVSVHYYLPLDSRATLLVVYQDTHGSGVTSGRCERGRFLNATNRALIRGVRAWRFMQG